MAHCNVTDAEPTENSVHCVHFYFLWPYKYTHLCYDTYNQRLFSSNKFKHDINSIVFICYDILPSKRSFFSCWADQSTDLSAGSGCRSVRQVVYDMRRQPSADRWNGSTPPSLKSTASWPSARSDEMHSLAHPPPAYQTH